ncbi:hypothetical protein [Solimonas soli]|uniref:hypothetical protein n=1 Tax=Solimonas soli TaxID=413479 RepID=UPI0004824BAC|nr:hypothetical protein [Solimonas soli]
MRDDHQDDSAARLDRALQAAFSQSRPPQNLRRMIGGALRCASEQGLAEAVRFIEADVARNRASND